MKREILLEREYDHPPSLVWRALTEPDLIARWLMDTDFRPEVGHRFTLRAEPQPGWDGVVHCEVLELEPERLLRYSWVGGPLDTEIAFTLTPTGRGTRLRVRHTGFDGFKPVLVSLILGSGSRKIYGKLLPGVLDALASGGPMPGEDAECHEGGPWRVLAAIFSPILGRKPK